MQVGLGNVVVSAVQGPRELLHCLSHPVEHEPSHLVGDAERAVQLVGGGAEIRTKDGQLTSAQ